MKVRELVDKILDMDVEQFGGTLTTLEKELEEFDKAAAHEETGKAEETTVAEYKGEKNVMKLKKMAKEAGMKVDKTTTKAAAIEYLMSHGEETATEVEEEASSKGSITKENYKSDKRYTKEQLSAVPARELYNIATQVLGIHHSKCSSKNNSIKEILNYQNGVDGEDAAEVTESTNDQTETKYDGKKAQELYKECINRGLRVEKKMKADYYTKILVANDEDELEKEENTNEEAEESNYDTMKPQELYKLCKERGIEAEKKHPSAYYIDILKADDEEDEDITDDDNWADDSGDDDEEWFK